MLFGVVFQSFCELTEKVTRVKVESRQTRIKDFTDKLSKFLHPLKADGLIRRGGKKMLSYEEVALRMIISLLVGTIVGYERSKQQKPAGVRTYSLVCIGSTLFMIVSAYGVPHLAGFGDITDYRVDPGRIAAQIVSGIGFLGAGVIWKEGGNIRGLTTAANLWITAGLGMAIGAGLYFLVFVSVICVFLALYSSSILCRLGLLNYPDDQQLSSQEQHKDTL